jgi:hypothetical protein
MESPRGDVVCRATGQTFMRASTFEFKARFWIIGIISWIGFFLYRFDKVNFAVGLLRLVAPGMDPDSARGEFWLRVIFFAGALLVFLAAMLRTRELGPIHDHHCDLQETQGARISLSPIPRRVHS